MSDFTTVVRELDLNTIQIAISGPAETIAMNAKMLWQELTKEMPEDHNVIRVVLTSYHINNDT